MPSGGSAAMSHSECLTEQQLSAYQLGEVSSEEVAELSRHLEECSRCAANLARLDNLTDPVIVALRNRPAVSSQPAQRLSDTFSFTPTPLRENHTRSLPGYEILEELG